MCPMRAHRQGRYQLHCTLPLVALILQTPMHDSSASPESTPHLAAAAPQPRSNKRSHCLNLLRPKGSFSKHLGYYYIRIQPAAAPPHLHLMPQSCCCSEACLLPWRHLHPWRAESHLSGGRETRKANQARRAFFHRWNLPHCDRQHRPNFVA